MRGLGRRLTRLESNSEIIRRRWDGLSTPELEKELARVHLEATGERLALPLGRADLERVIAKTRTMLSEMEPQETVAARL